MLNNLKETKVSFIRKIMEVSKIKDFKIPDQFGPKVEIIILPINTPKPNRKHNFEPSKFYGLTNINNIDSEINKIRAEWDRY